MVKSSSTPITILLLKLIISSNDMQPVASLYADEAGINDFVLRTAGHGQVGVKYSSVVATMTAAAAASASDGVWVTSQSNEFPAAVSDKGAGFIDGSNSFTNVQDSSSVCSIAGRNVTSGEVLWRVNACSSSGSRRSSGGNIFSPRHSTLASSTYSNMVYSLDNVGIFRAWDAKNNGMLQLDVDMFQQITLSSSSSGHGGNDNNNKGVDNSNMTRYHFPNGLPRLLDTLHPRIIGTVVTTTNDNHDDEFLVLLDTKTGQLIQSSYYSSSSSSSKGGGVSPPLLLSAKSLLIKSKVPKKKYYDTARIVDFFFVNDDNGGGDNINNANMGNIDNKKHPARVGGGSKAVLLVAWSTNQEIIGPKNIPSYKSVSTFSSMAWVDIHVKEGIQASPPRDSDVIPRSEDYDDWSTTAIKAISYTYEVGKITSTPFQSNVDGGGMNKMISSTPFLLSSLRKVYNYNGNNRLDGGGNWSNNNNNSLSLLAIASTTSQLLLFNNVVVSATNGSGGNIIMRSYEIDILHPYWRFIDSISTPQVIGSGNVATLTIAGVDDRYPIPRRIESLFVLKLDNESISGDKADLHPFHRVNGSEKKSDEDVLHNTVVLCPNFQSPRLKEHSSHFQGLVVTALEDEEANGDDIVAKTFFIVDENALRGGSWSHSSLTWSSVVVLDGDSVIVPSSRGGVTSIGPNDRAHLLECSQHSMIVAFTTTVGMTTAFRFEVSSESERLMATKLWTSEEALGSISSAVFLDETHSMVTTPSTGTPGNADDEEEIALRNLQFSRRIQMQLESLKDGIFGGGLLSSLQSIAIMSDEKKAERDIAFGFAKVVVLLSETMHRVVALDTMKKTIIWSTNLHSGATWHKIVHGGQFISLNDPHGNGGVHDHEMLALSYIEGASSSKLEWKCFDGLSGRTFSGDTLPVIAAITQIVPLRTSSHQPHLHTSSGCRQAALLVHSDNTVSVIPNTTRSRAIVDEAMTAAEKNGLFVHSIDKHTGEFRSQIVSRKAGSDLELESNSFKLATIGATVFDPSEEKIVNIAYPQRGEVVQSPSTVLGDESLLLKYLNPHLVVVVTEATPTFFLGLEPDAVDGNDMRTENVFFKLLVDGDGTSSSRQKRKPLGAATPGEGPPSSVKNSATPSLFVSLVDSVSGQILHRVSHSHVDSVDQLDATNVPVVISENWIVYSFFNQRTRRTDIGVLTLHEGMIDKNGITAFSAPEQEVTFSSLESSKPIVLSRTFGLAKAVSALGVTSTKAGISSKQFMIATANDQVTSLDRRFLDPRRPNGDLKESEKMEGLMKYSPMLPIIPFLTPSHIYEVSSVQSIASASAIVESQSLVLAYGGPDIFFSRVSPSKGFDLLPDDFNRGLLTVVLVGLLTLLNVIQRLNKKKMVASFWS